MRRLPRPSHRAPGEVDGEATIREHVPSDKNVVIRAKPGEAREVYLDIDAWKVDAVAERGRAPGFRMSEEHRVKIQNSNILTALISHVLGEREMSSTQVTAGLGLLRKVMPDLASVDASVNHNVADPLTALLEQIALNGKRIHD